MLPVTWRTRIISRRDGILAPNPAIQTFRYQLPAARVEQHFTGALLGFFLCGMCASRPISIELPVYPDVITSIYHSIISAHNDSFRIAGIPAFGFFASPRTMHDERQSKRKYHTNRNIIHPVTRHPIELAFARAVGFVRRTPPSQNHISPTMVCSPPPSSHYTARSR